MRDDSYLVFSVAACLECPGKSTGVSRKDFERVFEPLLPKLSKGTSLRLTICQELIKLHGGTVAVESGSGSWTSVTVTLPRRNLAASVSDLFNSHHSKQLRLVRPLIQMVETGQTNGDSAT